MRILVLMGGISAEREVSLKSGAAILQSLIRQGYDAYGVDYTKESNIIEVLTKNEYDVVFMALHGEFGEDGRIQGLLDLLGKKYTGSKAASSAVALDKHLTKLIADDLGITIPRTYKKITDVDSYPVVIKPVTEGSSVGIYICNTEEESLVALENLKDKEVIIEKFIKGEELTVGVLENEALGVLKIKPHSGVYDYESKYTAGKTTYEYPAKVSSDIYKKAMEDTELIHKELGLSGGTRSDFILDGETIYFLEVNTCPGMTETSLLPKLATLKGYDFDELVKKILLDVA